MSVYADPNALAGRQGPLACILSIASDPGASVSFSPVAPPRCTKVHNDLPTFVPEAVAVTAGKWYYEIELETNGLIQAGACIRDKFTATTGRGNGVGDDDASWGYDGSKNCVLATKATLAIPNGAGKWSVGDRIGVGINMDAHIISWYKNGEPLIETPLSANKSKFQPGDALTPAVSLSGRQSAIWFFEVEELRHLPDGFMPFQQARAQESLYAPMKAPESEQDDPLAFANVKRDLDIALTTLSRMGTVESKELDARVMQFAKARGGVFEYGVESKLTRFADSGTEFEKYCTGTLPKLEVPRGQKNALDYLEVVKESKGDRRRMAWFVIALAHVYPHSKVAAGLAAKIKAGIDAFDASVGAIWEKLRYIAALEDRKENKVLDSGLYWQLTRFQEKLDTDRSKLSVAQQQDFIKDVTKVAGMLTTWRAWFVQKVGDIPFHTSVLEVLDASLAKFNDLFDPKAMEKEAAEKALEASSKKLEAEISRGKSRIEDCLKEFERFPDRAEEGYKTLNANFAKWRKEFDAAVDAAGGNASDLTAETITKLGASACVNTPLALEWKSVLDAATANWEREEGLRLLKREAKEALRLCKGKLNEALDLVDHYRTEEAIVKLHQGIEAVANLKARPGFLGLDFLDEFFFGADGYESLKAKVETKIYETTKSKACSEHSRVLNGHLSQIKQLMSHHRQEDALIEYNKAVGKHGEIMDLTDDYRNEERVKAALLSYEEEIPKFLHEYKERVVTVQARDKIGSLKTKLSTAQDMVAHYRETEALAEAQKVEEALGLLRDDAMLGTAVQVLEFAEICEEELPKIRYQANQQIINREVKEVIRVLEGTYNETQDHFEHYRFEHCLESLAKYRELGAELEKETRYKGRSDVEEALNNFDTRIPLFEKMYREKMARRALDEEVRVARGVFGSAVDMFEHSRFDECLVELQKAREKVDELGCNELYCDDGELSQIRDTFVNTCRNETIPDFLAKYTEKVVTRKAQDVAREINSSLSTAQQQISHYQYEAFLESINKVKEQIADARPSDDLPADSEAWLIYNQSVTQNCLNEASKEIYTLTQDYEQKQFDRNLNELIRNLNAPLGEATDLLSHSRFEDSLSALCRAQEALSALSLVASPKAAECVATATKDIKAFQNEYAAVTSKRRDNDLSRAVVSEIDSAKQLFSHHRNEETLAVIQKARENIDAVAQQGSTAIQGNIAEWKKQLEVLEQQYCERVLAREADQAISAARSELKFCEDHFNHYREEKALVSLNAAREHAAALAINERISKLPQVVAFYAEFTAAQPGWNTKLEGRAIEREVNANVLALRSALSALQQFFSHHQDEHALASYSKIKDELMAFTEDPRFASHDATVLVKADAEKQCQEFLSDYRDRVVSKRFNEMERTANAKYNEAVDKLGRCMFTEAIESYYAARETCGKIGGEQLLFGYQPAETFIKAFAPKLEVFCGQIGAKQRERALENAKREVNGYMNVAKQDFDHHRDEASLVQLNKARDFLDAYEREFGSDDFVSTNKKEQSAFEKAYCDRVFEAELSRRERKVRERCAASKEALSHHRHEEAIRNITEADDAAQELATDDRFLHLDRVSKFLKEHVAVSNAQRKSIQDILNSRAAADAERNISAPISTAIQCYEHYRFEESLQAISKASELAEEAGEARIVSEAVLAPLIAKIAAFKTKYQTERLSAEADAQARAVTSILNNATFLLSHHRHEDCMTALQQARDEATKLGESKYAGLPAVVKFFQDWPTQFSTIKDQLNEKLFAIRVRDAISAIKGTIREAETCTTHNMSERAITAVQKARDEISELRETPDLAPIDAVVSFTADASKQIQALATRISNDLFSREVDDVIRSAKSQIDLADNYFARYAFESSLQAFNVAKEVVEGANEDPRFVSASKLQEFVNKVYNPFVTSFSKKYADAVLADEARKAAADIKGHLALSTLYLERNSREKCVEELVAAQESAASTFQSDTSMLRTLSIATEVLGEVKKLHGVVSVAFLQKDADNIIRSATKISARIRANAVRLLGCSDEDVAALREAIAPLLGSDELKEPIAPIYTALPLVSQFILEEMQTLFKTSIKQPLYFKVERASRGGKGSSGAHDYDADPAGLGKTIATRWPQISEIRKGLPSKNIGPDVHPRYFDGLKILNQESKNLVKYVKEAEAAILSMEWDGDSKSTCYPFVNKNIIEDIDRDIPKYVKGIQMIEDAIGKGDAEKLLADEFYQQIKTAFDAWMVAWVETKAHFNNAEKVILRYRSMSKGLSVLEGCLEECRNVSSYRSNQHLQRSVFLDFFSIDCIYDKWALLPFKWGDFYSGNTAPEQTEMFTIVSKIATSLKQAMDTWGKDTKGGVFPNAAGFNKVFDSTINACRFEHAQLGYRRLCETCYDWKDTGARDVWFKALRRYPIARKYAVELGNKYAADIKVRAKEPWDIKILLVDPIGVVSDADPEEKEEWYAPSWEWVIQQPTTEHKLPFDKKADKSTTASSEVWTAICKKNTGKIVFAADEVQANGSIKGGGDFVDKFNLKDVTSGKGISARAFWPRALSNYPIAKDKKTGKALYGPAKLKDDAMDCEIFLMASIDGVQIENIMEPENGLTMIREMGRAGDTGLYKSEQSCLIGVLADNLDDPSNLGDYWKSVGARFAYEFSKLSPGEHKVALELRFRLFSHVENAFSAHPEIEKATRLFPFHTTPMSAPIATGTFTLVVPKEKVVRRSILPKQIPLTNISADSRLEMERMLLAHLNKMGEWGARSPKREIPIHVTLISDVHVSEVDTFFVGLCNEGYRVFQREPCRNGRDFRLVVRRKKADGWPSETVGFFKLEAVTNSCRNPPKDLTAGNVSAIWVANGHFQVDARLLSEEDEKLVPH